MGFDNTKGTYLPATREDVFKERNNYKFGEEEIKITESFFN